jgi:hypothetical protein
MPLPRAVTMLVATVALTATVLVGLVAGHSAASAAGTPPARGHDKVGDPLESRLARTAAREQIPVIVTLARPVSPTRLARSSATSASWVSGAASE